MTQKPCTTSLSILTTKIYLQSVEKYLLLIKPPFYMEIGVATFRKGISIFMKNHRKTIAKPCLPAVVLSWSIDKNTWTWVALTRCTTLFIMKKLTSPTEHSNADGRSIMNHSPSLTIKYRRQSLGKKNSDAFL